MIVNLFITDDQAIRFFFKNDIEYKFGTVTEWSSTYHNKCEPREVERLLALHNGEWKNANEVISNILIKKFQ